MHRSFNLNYNKDLFKNIWEENKHDVNVLGTLNKVNKDLTEISEVVELFNILNINPVLKDNADLVNIVGPIGHHTNPRNNGIIVFPIDGILELSFYRYVPETIIDGRPTLKADRYEQSFIDKINNTHEYNVYIRQPTAINGTKVHNYRPIIKNALFFALKIPFGMTWEDLMTTIDGVENEEVV